MEQYPVQDTGESRYIYVAIIAIIIIIVIAVLIFFLFTRTAALAPILAPITSGNALLPLGNNANPIITPSNQINNNIPLFIPGSNVINAGTSSKHWRKKCHQKHKHHRDSSSDCDTSRGASCDSHHDSSSSSSSGTSRCSSRSSDKKSEESKKCSDKDSSTCTYKHKREHKNKHESESSRKKPYISSSKSCVDLSSKSLNDSWNKIYSETDKSNDIDKNKKINKITGTESRYSANSVPQTTSSKYFAYTGSTNTTKNSKHDTLTETLEDSQKKTLTETDHDEFSKSHTTRSSVLADKSLKFSVYDFNFRKIGELPELNGIVDYMICHEGQLYVHILNGHKSSGVYIYDSNMSKWCCLLGTGNNNTGRVNSSNLDVTNDNRITHMYVNKENDVCVGTLTLNYSVKKENNKWVIESDKGKICMDQHRDEYMTAYVNNAGIVYINDNKIPLKHRLNPETTVRCYNHKLHFINKSNQLVCVTEKNSAGEIIDHNVNCYDTNDSNLCYIAGDKLYIKKEDKPPKTYHMPLIGNRIAISRNKIYIAYN